MADKTEYELTLDQFHEYLAGILKLYQRAIPILKDELNAIVEDELDVLNESLKSQQALLLQTRNFDRNVSGYLSKLGLLAGNLTEMANQLEKDQGLRFFHLLGEFEQTMSEVNYYKEKCRMLLQSKLYAIDKMLSTQEIQKDNTTYDKNAAGIQGTLFPKAFEKKI